MLSLDVGPEASVEKSSGRPSSFDTDTRGGELDLSGNGGGDCLPLTLDATDIRDATEFLLDAREPELCVLTL